MFKKVSLVLVSLVVMTSAALADDDLLNDLASSNAADIVDASVEVEDFNLDLDVDQLAQNADGEEVDAVEACFRRFGYRSWGWNYGYRCFRPYRHCYGYYSAPIYNYCRPVVSYWGCF